MNKSIVTQVVEKLSHLPDNLQRRVLEFVESLTIPTQRGIPGKQLLRFAGSISLEDIQQIQATIETGCEQVDLNEW